MELFLKNYIFIIKEINMNIEILFDNILKINDPVLFLKQLAMWAIGGLLIFLAIKKKMEPTLLLPMGFGAILMNIPNNSGSAGISETLGELYEMGISNELFPLILFIGIGAMIDFGPILSNPKLMIFGAAAQFGIFMTLSLASIFFGFKEAASIAIIGAADGPTSIVVAGQLAPNLLGPITVAAYSYMALVPIVQPPVIKAVTTKKERRIRMAYKPGSVSKLTRILFPIIVTIIAALIAPGAAALVGFLMFGNLIRECGVLESLSETAQNVLANLVTIFLGISVSFTMKADAFISWGTALILGLGLFAFIFDTFGGVMLAKLMNIFLPEGKKINPMIGAAGISAFPMSARIVNKMGLEEDNQNYLLMHAVGANVSGQVASVIAGGLILNIFTNL